MSGRPRVAHRMNVNLTQRGWDALQESVNLTGDSMTDTVNRALQAYAFFRVAEKKGQSACLWDENSGQITRLNFL